MLSFKVTKHEFEAINEIAQRARALLAQAGEKVPIQELLMDITAVHANGCPLRLEAFAAADGFSFTHDICGIRQHLNRETGKLENCFLPRFSA